MTRLWVGLATLAAIVTCAYLFGATIDRIRGLDDGEQVGVRIMWGFMALTTLGFVLVIAYLLGVAVLGRPPQ